MGHSRVMVKEGGGERTRQIRIVQNLSQCVVFMDILNLEWKEVRDFPVPLSPEYYIVNGCEKYQFHEDR